jgi:hypothetical protein
MVFQLSHGQKLNSHNLNILLLNLSMKMPKKRDNVLPKLKESLRLKEQAVVLLELSLLNQFHQLEIKWPLQISSKDLEL